MHRETNRSDFVDDNVRYEQIPPDHHHHDRVPAKRDSPGVQRHRWAAFSILGVALVMLLGVYVVWQSYIVDSVAISQSVVTWLAVGAIAIGLLLGGIAASIIYATAD